MEELLEERVLDLSEANGADIPYEGWMGVEFTLSKNTVSDLEHAIIGFNMLEELALGNDTSGDCIPSGHMVQRLCSALEVGCKTASAVLSVLKKQKLEISSQIARLGRRPVTIPKNKVIEVECDQLNKRVLSGSLVLLEPNQEAP